MNYRHAYHAGNFADVIKHALLVRILMHLRAKPAAFRVIDTHAGAGLYDLASIEASRSGEWREGIGRLLEHFPEMQVPDLRRCNQTGHPERAPTAPLSDGARALLAPYLGVIAALNGARRLTTYPGSPALARALLRAQDRLIASELEPAAAAALAHSLAGDRRSKAVAIDGWTALNAYLPPRERRGLVLIDPAFEEDDEFPRLYRALAAAFRKWASGTYLVWYPIKERPQPDALARSLRRSGMARILRMELSIAAPRASARLAACGLIVANPPWMLESELKTLLPALTSALSGDGGGAHRIDWLANEK